MAILCWSCPGFLASDTFDGLAQEPARSTRLRDPRLGTQPEPRANRAGRQPTACAGRSGSPQEARSNRVGHRLELGRRVCAVIIAAAHAETSFAASSPWGHPVRREMGRRLQRRPVPSRALRATHVPGHPILDDGASRSPFPVTAMHTRSDGIVPWKACIVQKPHRTAENLRVRGSHIGLGHNPAVVYVVADRLSLADGAWEPLDRSLGPTGASSPSRIADRTRAYDGHPGLRSPAATCHTRCDSPIRAPQERGRQGERVHEPHCPT